jgi:hypothetical protein
VLAKPSEATKGITLDKTKRKGLQATAVHENVSKNSWSAEENTRRTS